MATPFKSISQRLRSWFTSRPQQPLRKQGKRCRPLLEVLEDRTLPSVNPGIGDVFYIDMENHNLMQPTGLLGSPEQLQGNPAAPYLNSLMTPGNPNAAQTSYASNYTNVASGVHPSEPNYVWQEGGSNFGVFNDDDPYANNGNPNPNLNNNMKLIAATGNNPANLSGLLQAAAIPWKSYQEDIDMTPTSGSVNQPGAGALTSTVAPQSQWTVPTTSFSGTSTAYTNPYNGSHQYNFAVKHDGQLFYTDTNGGTLSAPNFSPSNPEAQYYAPLQQLQTDLNNNTVARYNLISPDQYNDMHSSLSAGFTYNGVHYTGDQSAIAAGDNFLSIIVPQIMASQAYKNNGTIVIWYDETEGGDTSAYTVPEIVISPLAKGNAYDSTLPYTHSSDLKSLQELFGVSAPGGGFLGDANTPGTNDLADMFVPVPGPGATQVNNTLYLVGGNTNDQLNITPTGASQTGSTGIKVNGRLDNMNINNQLFNGVTNIVVVGYGGNDQVQFANSLTIATTVSAGDGNDQVQLDNGNNLVTLGNGNDQVQGGNGNNLVTLGTGNDQVHLGDGTNTVRVGAAGSKGNSQVQLGNGASNLVTLLGDGNDQIQAGDGAGNNVSITGTGNDQVKLGDGNNDSVTIMGNGNDYAQVGNGNGDSVSITGNGNDQIQVGNGLGDFLSMVGDGNDNVQTGNGSGQAHVSGSGHKNVHLGSGWTQI